LDDHLITVSRNHITQPGDVVKIAGEGMPVHQSSDAGDLFVRIDIDFPEKLTEQQKESKIINSYYSC
jgi:DnaJ-class molecular chaperone